jgi:hypothetical protein
MDVRRATLHYILQTQWVSPLCVTLTEKQCVDGVWIDSIRSSRNARHFLNVLNTDVYGNSYRRFGKKVRSLLVQETSGSGRHHLHGVFDIPVDRDATQFKLQIESAWRSSRYGYREIKLEVPTGEQNVSGYLSYIMKDRTKLSGLCDAVDWENSSVLELC